MRKKIAELAVNPAVAGDNWSPISNSAVRDLLDHLADELAKEYIRLMKQAAAGNNADTDICVGGHGE